MKVESIIRIALPKYVIVIHQSRNNDWQYEHGGYSEIDLIAHTNQDLPMRDLANILIEVEGVSSVEIVDWNNNGLRIIK